MAPNDLPLIDPRDLRPGDVALSRGIGTLSDLIARVDGGDYSHAALFDGKGLVQATTQGIVCSVPPARVPEHQTCVHIYRFHDADGKELDAPGLPSRPVTDAARSLVGGKYAYDELLLLAVVFYMRGRSAVPYLRDVVRLLGGAALSQLRRWIRYLRNDRSTAMVCTEVVASSFWKPSDSRGVPYGLRVKVWRGMKLLGAPPPQLAPELEAEYAQLLEEVEQLVAEARPDLPPALRAQRELEDGQPPAPLLAAAPGGGVPDEIVAGSALLPAGCVAPRDLQNSPSLHRIGRLA